MSLLRRQIDRRTVKMGIQLCIGLGIVLSALLSLNVQMAVAADLNPPPVPAPFVPRALADDGAGFQPIFDGRTLQGWDGNREFWRVEGGAIVGEAKEQHPLPVDSGGMLIWRGGRPADFELKLEYRINSTGNSGIHYRSVETPWLKWGLGGYQADIDGAATGELFAQRFARPRGLDTRRMTGMNYDEWGRTVLALPGQVSYVGTGEPQRVVASLGDGEMLAAVIHEGWNRYHLIARGNFLIHIVNDRVMTIVIDDDVANGRREGLLGLQIKEGHAMKVEFRNIRLKSYLSAHDKAESSACKGSP